MHILLWPATLAEVSSDSWPISGVVMQDNSISGAGMGSCVIAAGFAVTKVEGGQKLESGQMVECGQMVEGRQRWNVVERCQVVKRWNVVKR
nr:hypothetical protein BgiMline_018187 [Biomphalaria glabrata]